MSEHFDEHLSRFIDDDMSAEECEFFVRRLQRDETARASYKRIHLIGAVLRNEHRPFGLALARREGEGQGAEPRRTAATASARAGAGWRSGFGIAASIALIAIAGVGLNSMNSGESPTAGGATRAGLESGTIAVPEPVFPPVAEETGLQYLIHHTGYSSGVPATIMRSGFVAAPMTDLMWEPGAALE